MYHWVTATRKWIQTQSKPTQSISSRISQGKRASVMCRSVQNFHIHPSWLLSINLNFWCSGRVWNSCPLLSLCQKCGQMSLPKNYYFLVELRYFAYYSQGLWVKMLLASSECSRLREWIRVVSPKIKGVSRVFLYSLCDEAFQTWPPL